MGRNAFSHVVGFDDAPFPRSHRGNVRVVGAIFAGLRLEGVVSGVVRRDGVNSTRTLSRLVTESKFAAQLQLILLQGIALAGFNVVDLHALHRLTGLPVLVVTRRAPRPQKIREALEGLPGGRKKWALIEQLGPMEPTADVYVQRVGLSSADAGRVVRRLAVHGHIPEPLRAAHLIAGGVVGGQSRGRP
jgi:endonuclease V-like protein UPF0215 family